MLYKIALFLHVTGALLLFAALAIEWLCIANIKKARTIEHIKESVLNYSKAGALGGIAAILILVPGIYMMVTVWNDARWGMGGFLGLILIGQIGNIVIGRKMKKVKTILKTGNGESQALATLLQNKSFWLVAKVRTAIFFGVIFLMTVKPGLEGSIITLAVSILLGALPLRVKNYTPSSGLLQEPQKK
jgi:hypothetical protein